MPNPRVAVVTCRQSGREAESQCTSLIGKGPGKTSGAAELTSCDSGLIGVVAATKSESVENRCPQGVCARRTRGVYLKRKNRIEARPLCHGGVKGGA